MKRMYLYKSTYFIIQFYIYSIKNKLNRNWTYIFYLKGKCLTFRPLTLLIYSLLMTGIEPIFYVLQTFTLTFKLHKFFPYLSLFFIWPFHYICSFYSLIFNSLSYITFVLYLLLIIPFFILHIFFIITYSFVFFS